MAFQDAAQSLPRPGDSRHPDLLIVGWAARSEPHGRQHLVVVVLDGAGAAGLDNHPAILENTGCQ